MFDLPPPSSPSSGELPLREARECTPGESEQGH